MKLKEDGSTSSEFVKDMINRQHETEEISLKISTYEDIFSVFDPRPYSRKALSQDFLEEIKRASADASENVELNIIIPRSKRNMENETAIRMRLHEHFKRHHEIVLKEANALKRKGVIMTFFGVFFIIVSGILRSLGNTAIYIYFLIALFEPAGWFTAWTGLDQIFYGFHDKKKNIEFNKKMMHATINFINKD